MVREVESGKRIDPRTGHTISMSHYLEMGSPPVSVTLGVTRSPFAGEATDICPACGKTLRIGDWPCFCDARQCYGA